MRNRARGAAYPSSLVRTFRKPSSLKGLPCGWSPENATSCTRMLNVFPPLHTAMTDITSRQGSIDWGARTRPVQPDRTCRRSHKVITDVGTVITDVDAATQLPVQKHTNFRNTVSRADTSRPSLHGQFGRSVPVSLIYVPLWSLIVQKSRGWHLDPRYEPQVLPECERALLISNMRALSNVLNSFFTYSGVTIVAP